MKFLIVILFFLASCIGPKKVILDGSRSYDPDGSIVKFKWEVIAGQGKFVCDTCVTTGYSYRKNSSVRLTVTDNKGAKGDKSVVTK